MNSQTAFLARLAAITAASLFLILAWQTIPLIQAKFFASRSEPRAITPRGDLAEDERSTIALFEARRGSVVFITTVQRAVNPWTGNPLQVRSGTGSGFVWDSLGHIVTNHHVVEGATEAMVSLADGRAFTAGLVGSSREHDLAVLRIGVGVGRPDPLPIGTSNDLRVGQKVFAIGNPFGLDRTLTTGIVSALNRELPHPDGSSLTGLVQTDAAINPGNSGGPLLDSAGRLIGVNTAIFSPSGASAGIGFAVPVDVVNRVIPKLISTGRYVRPSLGVRAEQEINAALAARLGIEGVFVLDVEAGSAAERAGIRPARLSRNGGFQIGDVILAISGRPVRTVAELSSGLEAIEPGQEVRLTILREGRQMEVPIPIAGAR
jgi:S1-C subfamily serine protease